VLLGLGAAVLAGRCVPSSRLVLTPRPAAHTPVVAADGERVGPDLQAALRCPGCAAAVRPGAPWCTQCFTDLTPARQPAREPVVEPAREPVVEPAREPVVEPHVPEPGGTWPCGSCGRGTPLADDACAGCGAPFLAPLRVGEQELLRLPVVGDLGALARRQLLGLAGGVVLAVLLLVALVCGLAS
jgi:hypothetical protein